MAGYIILAKSTTFNPETIIAVDHKSRLSAKEFENFPIAREDEVSLTRKKIDHGNWMLSMI
ncbi:hypothetical protein NBG4_160020 [Candidatus Sulfobium mesophilum]|uniref:Uncharacterized protein n=1 Tax=Candidatus Sulfobium mesophilum TaxID=2016548 RepID=A0A2U3QFC9_9BACT|nr:hypothetical protein NBG4_160020 [Candidatus Sulfobium mesophilum]